MQLQRLIADKLSSFGFKTSSYKSEEVELILSFKNRIIQILMQKVVTVLQFTRSG